MSEVDLSVGLAGRRLANPTLLASGVAGDSVESLLSAIEAGAGGRRLQIHRLEAQEGVP